MLAFAAQYPEVVQCFPVIQREVEKLPRYYVANVIFTIVGERFKNWVEEIVNERHELRRQEDDTIEMDPDIARVFNASTATSGK